MGRENLNLKNLKALGGRKRTEARNDIKFSEKGKVKTRVRLGVET